MAPKIRLAVALQLALVLFAVGCKKHAAPAAADHSARPAAVAETSDAVIRGVVHFKGDPRKRVKIDMGQDPACDLSAHGDNLSEQYIVNDGGLANAFVYIKSGFGDQKFTAPTTPVILDQKGCRYVPHVVALMVGQTLRVLNSDMTMHNVHSEPSAPDNHYIDVSMAPGGKPAETSFLGPETMISVRCNMHPWMEAFVNVAANPYYTISDSTGHFEIHNVPAGDYTLAAVHEKLLEKTQTITVAPHSVNDVDFTFESR